MTETELTGDDAFIIGSICGVALASGNASSVSAIYRCLQQERPWNAGGFIMEAMALQQQERISEALDFLVEHDVLNKQENVEEALSLYAVLLVQFGDVEAGHRIAKAAVEEDQTVSESARALFQSILDGTSTDEAA